LNKKILTTFVVLLSFSSGLPQVMGYEDFCFFLLCEEDKTTEPSLRYWFDLVDLNLDGTLSPWEVSTFYEEQLKVGIF
jgi:serine/threonine-protein phosphatase 2A regulatory subunit B''